MRKLSWVALFAVASACSKAPPSTLVFAAVSTSEPIRALVSECQRAGLGKIELSLGASSDLARQIEAGAPADLFLSADRAQMDRLETRGLLAPGSRADLLSNELVVIQPIGATPLGAPEKLSHVTRLALANPRSVPIGVYARAWLEKRGWWSALEPKLLPTLDARATLAAVAAGGAEAGIVYRTDAAISDRVRVVFRVPRDEAPSVLYPIAQLVHAPSPRAGDVLACVTSSRGKDAFQRGGFIWLGR